MSEKELTFKTTMDVWKKIEQVDKGKFGRIPSYLGGYTLRDDNNTYDFDRDILDEGFFRGVVHTITGFPGEGKTSLSIQMASRQAEAGYKVLYITLEQDEEEITEKFLGIVSGLPYKIWEDVKFRDKETFTEWKDEGEKFLHAYYGNDLHVVHASLTVKSAVYFLKEVIAKDMYDVIYFDNFQNCTYSTKEGRTEQFETLSNEVRQLIAAQKKCAFIWLSQLSLENGKPATKWCRKLNEDVATRIMVDRGKKEKDNPNDIAKSYVHIKKNRKGKAGVLLDDLIFAYDVHKGRIGSFSLTDINLRLEERQMKERNEKLDGKVEDLHTYIDNPPNELPKEIENDMMEMDAMFNEESEHDDDFEVMTSETLEEDMKEIFGDFNDDDFLS